MRELADANNRIMRLYNYLVALPAVESLIRLRVPGLAAFTTPSSVWTALSCA